MKQINVETESRGGLAYIYAIPHTGAVRVHRDYATGELWPEFRNRDKIVRLPVLESGQHTFRYSEEHGWAESGDVYHVAINGYIPRTKEVTDKVLHQLETGRWRVLHVDRNGTAYLSGTEDIPLKFTRTRDSGDSPAAQNAVSFTFSAVEPEPSPRMRISDFELL